MVRIKEFKKMVKTFHENGLNVVMDVVYNHTMFLEESNFNQLVPGYYYRQNTDGSFSNASACGNETASERYMFRKFIIESLVHWVKEYHIDGFRFDLMGIHDIETMNEIAKTLRAIKPSILLYGEGWTAADSPLPEEKRAIKKYAYKLGDIAVFGDDMRDGVKGSVFHHKDTGFVSGKKEEEESIKLLYELDAIGEDGNIIKDGNGLTYPNYRQVIPKEYKGMLPAIGFNPAFLYDLGQAIEPENKGVSLRWNEASQALGVRALTSTAENYEAILNEGGNCSLYSASVNRKDVSDLTLANS
jgi:hypothetical protein